MKLFVALVFASVLGSTLAQDCIDDYYGTKCLTKAEMGADWADNFIGGDPCFLSGGQRWCFTDKSGNMGGCKCSIKACGCKAAGPTPPPPPKCDNSNLPTSFPTKCGTGWGENNSMCKYKSMGSACGKVCIRGLTADEKKVLLDKHNDLRRRVAVGNETIGNQPKAANMEELIWDDELAVSAQRWTDQCEFGHDENRRTAQYDPVGQNSAISESSANSGLSEANLKKFVQYWYDEVQYVRISPEKFDDSQPPNTGVIGHYTQVVWAKSKKVGCGFIQIEADGWFKKLINCNYYPAANLMGAPIYEIGEPGSKCAKSNNGLCV